MRFVYVFLACITSCVFKLPKTRVGKGLILMLGRANEPPKLLPAKELLLEPPQGKSQGSYGQHSQHRVRYRSPGPAVSIGLASPKYAKVIITRQRPNKAYDDKNNRINYWKYFTSNRQYQNGSTHVFSNDFLHCIKTRVRNRLARTKILHVLGCGIPLS